MENLDALHERHRVLPVGQTPEVPHLPEESTNQTCQSDLPDLPPVTFYWPIKDTFFDHDDLQCRDQRKRREPEQWEQYIRPHTDCCETDSENHQQDPRNPYRMHPGQGPRIFEAPAEAWKGSQQLACSQNSWQHRRKWQRRLPEIVPLSRKPVKNYA